MLYLWLFHADQQGGMAQLMTSCDHGVHWDLAPWRFEEFGLCTFINFGQNYQGARDDYIYTVSHDGPKADGPAGQMILMCVDKKRILSRVDYEFFAGMDEKTGEPLWSRNIESRVAVFENEDACLRSGISYNAALRRYFWWQHLPNEPGHKDRGDTRFEGGFGVYEAPEPWGPWSTVYYTEKWDVGPGERGEFVPKWTSEDGKTMALAFSGDDHFCVRQATLILY